MLNRERLSVYIIIRALVLQWQFTLIAYRVHYTHYSPFTDHAFAFDAHQFH